MSENKIKIINNKKVKIPLLHFNQDDISSKIIEEDCFACKGKGKLRTPIYKEIVVCHVCHGACKVRMYSKSKSDYKKSK